MRPSPRQNCARVDISDLFEKAIAAFTPGKTRFIIEFFESLHGEGTGEAIGFADGDPPKLGEFVLRVGKGGFKSRHRVSKIIHIAQGNSLTPYLICPAVTESYYVELSDFFTDFSVAFFDRNGQSAGNRHIKRSIVPAVGTILIRNNITYRVDRHVHAALSHTIGMVVWAVEQAKLVPSGEVENGPKTADSE